MKDIIERLERIEKLRIEMDELVLSFDDNIEYSIANNLSGGWVTIEEAIALADGSLKLDH
jgi:uncharacterized FlaG/YvyC family protein